MKDYVFQAMVLLYLWRFFLDRWYTHHLISELCFSSFRLLLPRQLSLFLLCISLHEEVVSDTATHFRGIFLLTYLFFFSIAFTFDVREFIRSTHEEAYASSKIKTRICHICNVAYWFVSLLYVSSSINYITYICLPEQFTVPMNMTVFETAFEFLYYTFTLMMTYGGVGISANSVLSKSLQMIEILCFIVFIGTAISSFAEQITKQNNDNGNADTKNNLTGEQSNPTKPQTNNTTKHKKRKQNKNL